MQATLDLKAVRATFDRDGFVVVPDLIPPDALAVLRRHIDGVLDGEIKPNAAAAEDEFHTQWEPRVVDRADLPRRQKIRVIFHMAHSHDYFWKFANEDRVLDVIEALVGPDIRFYTDQMFVKPPKVGSEVPWHQDSAYWPDVDPGLLSCWVALDDVTIANGCVRFIPGSHKRVVPHHEIVTDNPNNITTKPGLVDPSKEVPVEMKAGSVCIHHSLAVHRSLPNTSDAPRRGWVLIYLPAQQHFLRPWNFKYGFKVVRGNGGELNIG